MVAAALATPAIAGPLLPTILGHDFSFDAYNQDGTVEYATNGDAPDTLVYTRRQGDHESISYRPNWPDEPVYPVWDEVAGSPTFGGDFHLTVEFTHQDAPAGDFDVSLVGTGAHADPNVPDLAIYGTLELGEEPEDILQGLLWALDLDEVVLYGYSDDDTYALEGVGTVIGGLIAERYNLLGDRGAVRGDLDLLDLPPGWFTPMYDPASDVWEEFRAGYSGETGWVPEPTSLVLSLVALTVLRRPR